MEPQRNLDTSREQHVTESLSTGPSSWQKTPMPIQAPGSGHSGHGADAGQTLTCGVQGGLGQPAHTRSPGQMAVGSFHICDPTLGTSPANTGATYFPSNATQSVPTHPTPTMGQALS